MTNTHNLQDKLENGLLEGGTVKALKVVRQSDGVSGHLVGAGATVPSDGASGWLPGALFFHIDGSTDETVLYYNGGSATSCNFDAFDSGLETELAAVTNGNGASKVGIEDSAGNFTAVNVEAALAEIFTTLAAVTNGNGASLIGIEDSATNYTATDVEAALAEVFTTFLKLAGGTLTGAVTNTVGAAAAAVAMRFGASVTEGLEIKVIDEDVTLTNAVETDLTETVPAGAVILSVQGNLSTAVTGDASGDDGLTKVGIGTTADPDKYGLSADLAKNTKIDTIPDWAVLSSEETVTVKAADDAGAAVTELFTAGGIVRVRIVYAVLNSLDDVA